MRHPFPSKLNSIRGQTVDCGSSDLDERRLRRRRSRLVSSTDDSSPENRKNLPIRKVTTRFDTNRHLSSRNSSSDSAGSSPSSGVDPSDDPYEGFSYEGPSDQIRKIDINRMGVSGKGDPKAQIRHKDLNNNNHEPSVVTPENAETKVITSNSENNASQPIARRELVNDLSISTFVQLFDRMKLDSISDRHLSDGNEEFGNDPSRSNSVYRSAMNQEFGNDHYMSSFIKLIDEMTLDSPISDGHRSDVDDHSRSNFEILNDEIVPNSNPIGHRSDENEEFTHDHSASNYESFNDAMVPDSNSNVHRSDGDREFGRVVRSIVTEEIDNGHLRSNFKKPYNEMVPDSNSNANEEFAHDRSMSNFEALNDQMVLDRPSEILPSNQLMLYRSSMHDPFENVVSSSTTGLGPVSVPLLERFSEIFRIASIQKQLSTVTALESFSAGGRDDRATDAKVDWTPEVLLVFAGLSFSALLFSIYLHYVGFQV